MSPTTPVISTDARPQDSTQDTPSSSGTTPTTAEPAVEVFAIHGAEPEVQAYAMAKYSRSALSMKESLREISSQRRRSFSIRFTFSTAIDRLRIWPILCSPSNVFQSSLPSPWPTNSDGTARSDRPDIRTSARAAISCRRSRTMNRTRSIGKQSIFCSSSTRRFRNRCFSI